MPKDNKTKKRGETIVHQKKRKRVKGLRQKKKWFNNQDKAVEKKFQTRCARGHK